jgi:type IV pilus assembly protein PilM
MRPFRNAKTLVGLDIGSSAVKAVELKPAGKGYRVTAIATEPLPSYSIVDSSIADAGAVADAVRRLFTRERFRSRQVATSMSGGSVIVKKISVPVMTASELDESIHWEAEQHVPFDIQDVSLDYEVLDAGTHAESRGTMEVPLVAAKKEKVAAYADVIARTGRKAVVIDVDAFALQNAYEANYGVSPEVIVLLNAGASAINVNVVSNGRSLFTRDISMGGNSYTEAVQRELSLPFDAAESAKKGHRIDGHTFDDVRPVLDAVTGNILIEIQKTFDFFRGTTGLEHIDGIVVSGGASAVEGFAEALAAHFSVSVHRFDPFRQVTFDPPRQLTGDLALASAVALGLALRKAGER